MPCIRPYAAAAAVLAAALLFAACKSRETAPQPAPKAQPSAPPAVQTSLTPPLMPRGTGQLEAGADRGMVMPVPYDASGPAVPPPGGTEAPIPLDKPVSIPGSDSPPPEKNIHPAKKAPPPL